MGQFQPNMAQNIIGWRGFKGFFLNEGPHLSPRGENSEIITLY